MFSERLEDSTTSKGSSSSSCSSSERARTKVVTCVISASFLRSAQKKTDLIRDPYFLGGQTGKRDSEISHEGQTMKKKIVKLQKNRLSRMSAQCRDPVESTGAITSTTSRRAGIIRANRSPSMPEQNPTFSPASSGSEQRADRSLPLAASPSRGEITSDRTRTPSIGSRRPERS